MHGSCVARCTCNKSDYCLSPFAIQQRASPQLRERRSGFNSQDAIKSASIQFRRTSPCHPIEVHTVKHLPSSLNASFPIRWRGGIWPKSNPAKASRGSEVKYGRHPTRRLSSTPSWERATHLSTMQQTPSSIPATEILLVRMMFCGHNIEFSCPAASTPHYMELPGCIRRSQAAS